MRKIARIAFAAAVATLLVASSALSPDALARPRYSATRFFDGLWSVTIVTRSGDCNQAYRYPLRIWDGRVYKADNDPNYNVGGAVARNGAIAVTVAGNGETAQGVGRLRRNAGGGIWHTTNGECSGQWTAERRG